MQEVAGSSPAATTIFSFLFSFQFLSFCAFGFSEQLDARTRYLCRHLAQLVESSTDLPRILGQ